MELSEKLLAAREYESSRSKEIPPVERPVYHMTTPIGWMNDPNGFSYYQGQIHLFFQYHPYNTFWGPMHWGHYVTPDYIKWELQPCAMAPDMDYDKDGCFSGSAVSMGDQHVLMYTGVKEWDENGEHITRQTQCIAFGDGREYVKYKNNPVITADMLPEGSSKVDFRDPKIWKEQDGFWSLVGSKDATGSGQLALFHSDNAMDWEFVKILDHCHHEYGEMWECPDFFPLGGRQVLVISPQFMEADGKEFHSGNNTVYFVGDYDQERKSWSRGLPHMVDFGLDFYAAQTMEASDGRRIMIGWLQSWDTRLTPDHYKWSGMMTIPRELSLKDGRLIQTPVREIRNYYQNEVVVEDFALNSQMGETEISGITGRSVDLTVHVKNGDYKKLFLSVAANEKYRTTIIVNNMEGSVSVNRAQAGFKKDFICERSMKVAQRNGEIKLRVLVDKNSVELFVNDGEQAMTTLIYTSVEASQILWSIDGNAVVDVCKNDIVVQ